MSLLNFEEAAAMAKRSSVEIYIITIQCELPQFTIYQLDYQGWSDPKDEVFLYTKFYGNLSEQSIEAETLPESKIKHHLENQLFFSPTFPVCVEVLKEYLLATNTCKKGEEDELAEKLKHKIDQISGIVEE